MVHELQRPAPNDQLNLLLPLQTLLGGNRERRVAMAADPRLSKNTLLYSDLNIFQFPPLQQRNPVSDLAERPGLTLPRTSAGKTRSESVGSRPGHASMNNSMRRSLGNARKLSRVGCSHTRRLVVLFGSGTAVEPEVHESLVHTVGVRWCISLARAVYDFALGRWRWSGKCTNLETR